MILASTKFPKPNQNTLSKTNIGGAFESSGQTALGVSQSWQSKLQSVGSLLMFTYLLGLAGNI
jgi:hypothetical protein